MEYSGTTDHLTTSPEDRCELIPHRHTVQMEYPSALSLLGRAHRHEGVTTTRGRVGACRCQRVPAPDVRLGYAISLVPSIAWTWMAPYHRQSRIARVHWKRQTIKAMSKVASASAADSVLFYAVRRPQDVAPLASARAQITAEALRHPVVELRKSTGHSEALF